MAEDLSPYLPLSAATLHVLLALAGEDRHGYGIMQEVARQSEGQYKLGPGTLYDNLQKLMDRGMGEDTPPRASTPPASSKPPGSIKPGSIKEDARRRYYRLTRFGRGVLAAEIARLEN